MELVAEIRTTLGKQLKGIRKNGLIPAELYGHNIENAHLTVPKKEFSRVFKEAGTNTVINLKVGKETRPVVIHDLDQDFIKHEVLHIDFYQVSLKEVMRAKVPLEFTGESSAVKEMGGRLNKAMAEIEVEALPSDLPHRLTIDLSPLAELNQSIYIKDLVLPRGVEVMVDPETVIVTVTPPQAEEVVEVPVDLSAVKTEAEEKKAKKASEVVEE